MILDTTSKASESKLISSGFNSNDWQKLFLLENFTLHTKFHLTGKINIFGVLALKCFDLLGIENKIWTSPDLNSMRWLGLFTNKTFRKHLKLIFPHRDFIICIMSWAIFHPHFSIRNLPSTFYRPHFSIHHPPFASIQSALYRDPPPWPCLFSLFASLK